MLTNFLTVAEQVVVLFLLIGVGALCAKTGIIKEVAIKSCSDLVLIVVTPCVIIQSFQRPFDAAMLKGLGLACLIALSIHIVTILLAHLLPHDPVAARERVLRVGAVLSNAGFMSLPLQNALLGEDGVFYGAAYVAIFNLILWSYGLVEMSGSRQNLSPRKLILNPGVLSLAIGLMLFLVRITLPTVLASPMGHLAALNTPLPMLIIGFYLADTDLKAALRDWRSYAAIGLRLLVVPLTALGILYLCGVRGTLLVSMIIAASAPVAASTTMFATKYDCDTGLSVNLVSLSTLLSLITMPLIVALAQVIA